MSVGLAKAYLAGGDSPPLRTDTTSQLADTVVTQDKHITDLESAIRETIPVLERSGRAVLAVKLRKLIGG